MDEIVEVTIPVETEAAALLVDRRTREAVGRIVSRLVRPHGDYDPLLNAMDRLADEAKRRGLTQDFLDAELAARKAERSGPSQPVT